MIKKFIASTKQDRIFSEWLTTTKNILVNAVAGSGKTTTMIELLKLCDYKTLFLAFNTKVQVETQAKIEKLGLTQGKAMTVHALGRMAVSKAYRRLTVKKNKNFEMVMVLQKKFPAFKNLTWKEKLRLSYTLVDMNDISRLYLTDDVEEIKKHLLALDKTIFTPKILPKLWEELLKLREVSYQNRSHVVIDFVDMIYLPVLKNLNIPVDPYYLMIDECQDISLCQHKLIDQLIAQGDIKKFIAVGDRNQAIYAFGGASASSFDLFLKKGDTVELPLDVCYRSKKKIVDCANKVYDVMHSFSAEDGIVDFLEDPFFIKPDSMVICRNTSPLVSLYFELLGMGKAAFIQGEDILQSILRFIKPYHSRSISSAKMEMENKLHDLSLKTTEAGRISHYFFKENYKNFMQLADNLCNDDDLVRSMDNKIKALFINQDNAIMLCTIHKAKGSEAEVVYILYENLIPSKFAKSASQLVQEENLRYVARTRAKSELYFLNPPKKQ